MVISRFNCVWLSGYSHRWTLVARGNHKNTFHSHTCMKSWEVNDTAEKFEFTAEKMEKIKQAAVNYREEIASYFKGMTVEVKDWRFAVGSTDEGHTIDAAVKLILKPKK